MRATATITIEPGKPDAVTDYERSETLIVSSRWVGSDADLDVAMNWSLGAPTTRHRKLAERLVAAIEAQVVFKNPTVKQGKAHTYVSCESAVYGRRLNADLKRLGF